ncbi:MAG: hypothetical protein HQL79_07435 [Magnetococcales bacterium]|nr:hypothetical protein [Magnetococcales bacterium]
MSFHLNPLTGKLELASEPIDLGSAFQGVWSGGTTYAKGQAVSFDGALYVAIQDANTNQQPDTATAWWTPVTKQGAQGPQGPAGADGAQGPQGPQGPAGADGAQGPQGPQGPAGTAGAQGPQGPQGPAGADGAQGPQGATGPQGPQGLAGQSIVWKDAWSGSTAYAVGDGVSYNGSSYFCLSAHTNHVPPDATYWGVLAEKGATGAQGPQGPAGADGTQGPQGSQGPQGPAGAQGPQGATGPQGPQGPAGQSIAWKDAWSSATAYAIGDGVSYGGSSYFCLTAHTNHAPPDAVYWGVLAEKGATGAQGPQGPAGADGAQGTQGPQGPAGADGAQGPQGATGPQGPQGLAGQNIVWKDAWSGSTAYAVGDGVSYNGSSYFCLTAHTNHVPPDAVYWGVLAEKGATGAPGSGGGLSGLNAGGIVFGGPSGNAEQDDDLRWDKTNKRLGIGINAPSTLIDIQIPAGDPTYEYIQSTATSLDAVGSWSGMTLAKMIDADYSISSGGYASSGTAPCSLGFTFPNPRIVKTITFYRGYSGGVTFKVQAYNGSSWGDISIISWDQNCAAYNATQGTVTGGAGGDPVTFSVDPVVSSTQWRVYVMSFDSNLWITGLKMTAEAIVGNPYALTVTNTGRVGVGELSPTAKFHVTNEDPAIPASKLYSKTTVSTDVVAAYHSDIDIPGAKVCEVRATGGVYNVTGVYGTLSDERYKENMTPAKSQMADFMRVEFINYYRIGQDEKLLGVNANKFRMIYPRLVEETEDVETFPDPTWTPSEGQTEANRPWKTRKLGTTTLHVKLSVFGPPVMGVVLQEEITLRTALQARVAALEARVAALEAR